MPIERNRRNSQKQNDHLEEIRMLRDFRRKKKGLPSWDVENGRKIATFESSKGASVIAVWRVMNPECSNKSRCSRDTGLHRNTVAKRWNRE